MAGAEMLGQLPSDSQPAARPFAQILGAGSQARTRKKPRMLWVSISRELEDSVASCRSICAHSLYVHETLDSQPEQSQHLKQAYAWFFRYIRENMTACVVVRAFSWYFWLFYLDCPFAVDEQNRLASRVQSQPFRQPAGPEKYLVCFFFVLWR